MLLEIIETSIKMKCKEFLEFLDVGEKELSAEFYYYLCNIIGSENVVKKRREIFTSMNCVTYDNRMMTVI